MLAGGGLMLRLGAGPCCTPQPVTSLRWVLVGASIIQLDRMLSMPCCSALSQLLGRRTGVGQQPQGGLCRRLLRGLPGLQAKEQGRHRVQRCGGAGAGACFVFASCELGRRCMWLGGAAAAAGLWDSCTATSLGPHVSRLLLPLPCTQSVHVHTPLCCSVGLL